ncbi:MAG: polyprenyl synthetase family protein [Cytophagales bacterium]|nr:polyprenyl synthetase family protein [Bernardetiaceae bacterium]MDW8211692.1 polyprenyl synthetase family protein [Cytophagales bacterium]
MNFDLHAAHAALEDAIHHLPLYGTPAELYDPMRYIMSLGGKRMRPMLVLLGKYAVTGTWQDVVQPAIAVEMFHNFTLMHDDIMDRAPLRRGRATVHKKWDENVALLSGDAMLVKTYQQWLETVPPGFLLGLLKRFCQIAVQVCQGQQMDMNFEARKRVTMKEYLEMIRMKTAVLIGFSLEAGARLGHASEETLDQLYHFGELLGIGFQLKDDLLDVYGQPDKFGKLMGGDIIANKKTFLLVRALELANAMQMRELDYWLTVEEFDPQTKVDAVKEIYDQLAIKEHTENAMNEYFEKAFATLEQVAILPERRQVLREFARAIIERDQ